MDSPRADSSARSPRKGPSGDSPRRGAFTDSLLLGLASDSPRPRQVDTSPGSRGRFVPDWLSSPEGAEARSSSAGSKRLTPDSSFGGGLLGSPLGPPPHRASESTSPGAIHRTNVFTHPGSRPVSSEGSAEAAPQAVREHQPEKSIGENPSVVGKAKDASDFTEPEVIYVIAWHATSLQSCTEMGSALLSCKGGWNKQHRTLSALYCSYALQQGTSRLVSKHLGT